VLALDKQHLDHAAAVIRDLPGVVIHTHALRHRRQASRNISAIDLAGANAAISARRKIRMVAKPGNVNAGIVARF
jgi:hypothetical protein